MLSSIALLLCFYALILKIQIYFFSDDESHEGGHNHSEPPIFNDKQLSTLIDPVLREDDRNNDGMIDYAEFISAQIRTERGEKPVIQVSV